MQTSFSQIRCHLRCSIPFFFFIKLNLNASPHPLSLGPPHPQSDTEIPGSHASQGGCHLSYEPRAPLRSSDPADSVPHWRQEHWYLWQTEVPTPWVQPCRAHGLHPCWLLLPLGQYPAFLWIQTLTFCFFLNSRKSHACSCFLLLERHSFCSVSPSKP